MGSTTRGADAVAPLSHGTRESDGLSPLAVIARLAELAVAGSDLAPLRDRAIEMVTQVLDVEIVEILHGRRVDEWLEDHRAGGDHGAPTELGAEIPGPSGHVGVLATYAPSGRDFTADDADFLRSMAGILGGAEESARTGLRVESEEAENERLIRYHSALARCAQSLLANTGKDPLGRAVEELLAATLASAVFVERNGMDPDLGPCTRTAATARQPRGVAHEESDSYWEVVPWDRLPTTRSALERGESIVTVPSLLDGPEHALYADDPMVIASEIDVPIYVDGEWVGLVGLAERGFAREWTKEDRALLGAAAKMIGAYWERDSARDALLELVRSKDMVLASVSHELRAPLATVVGTSELLRDPSLELSAEERTELLDSVVAEGTDLVNIVNDLLAAAKADSGTLTVSRVRVSLRAQAAQVLEAIQQDTQTGIAMLSGSVTAIGDPGRVRQVVRNLVSNALRYGGDKTWVELDRNDGSAILRVCDNGTGIPIGDRERVFEAYESAHGVPGRAGSVGLGLEISRRLARLMGGDLTYDYDDGQSVFEFSLPEAD